MEGRIVDGGDKFPGGIVDLCTTGRLIPQNRMTLSPDANFRNLKISQFFKSDIFIYGGLVEGILIGVFGGLFFFVAIALVK